MSPNWSLSSIALRTASPKLARAAVTPAMCASAAATPRPVWFEERALRGHLDRPLGGAAECAGPFGDLVRVLFDGVGDLIEQFVDCDEGRTADIPMRLLDLGVQVDGGRRDGD